MGLEIVILSEVSQTQKDKYHMISLICRIKKKRVQMNLFTKQKQVAVNVGMNDRGEKVETSKIIYSVTQCSRYYATCRHRELKKKDNDTGY